MRYIKFNVFRRETKYPSFAAYSEPLVRGEEIFLGESPEEALAKAVAFASGAPWEALQTDDPQCPQFHAAYAALCGVPEEGELLIAVGEQ